MKKILILFSIIFISMHNLYSFTNGFVWALKFNFNGSATIPSIKQEDLNKMGIEYFKGAVGYSLNGELELGYLFGSERWFNMDNRKFSGMSLFGYLGVGTGYLGQGFRGTFSDNKDDKANIFVNINYAPVLDFGIGTKVHLLEDKLVLGLSIGGKFIIDSSPESYIYSDNPGAVETGTANHPNGKVTLPILSEVIMSKYINQSFNRLMLSVKFTIEYNQILSEKVSLLLGLYTRFNVYNPKYLVMTKDIEKIIQSYTGGKDFTLETKLPSYFVNSLDFGVSIGFAFNAN
ncbi:hypothetical protein [uncultured Brachyspira sp.]|uniref:hypothetical protein n=1 Tax=uncultured Brachyspira sp. TaxID=221953 RepID=UPI0025D702E9|nr:hypothetical protein [uncultured Brachyspira sp.]